MLARAALVATLASATTAAAAKGPLHATPERVGRVHLGDTYRALRKAKLVGPLVKGCPFDGHPSAALRAPLTGAVDLSAKRPRRVTSIVVSKGAVARTVRIGSRRRAVERAYPKATFDASVKPTFGITLVKVPKGGGGRLQLAIDARTHRVSRIGVPIVPFCE